MPLECQFFTISDIEFNLIARGTTDSSDDGKPASETKHAVRILIGLPGSVTGNDPVGDHRTVHLRNHLGAINLAFVEDVFNTLNDRFFI